MKTFIFCTAFIYSNSDSKKWYKDNSKKRYLKWVEHYSKRKKKFGADFLFLIDDGSDNLDMEIEFETIRVEYANNLPYPLSNNLVIFHFPDHLGRASRASYPGWWRSFTYSVKIAQKYFFDKIIHIESDFFVISDKLIQYIKELNQGWTALYSRTYQFPETGIQIICKDSFARLEDFHNRVEDYFEDKGMIAEHILPFTNVEKGFIGDRFSEKKVFDYWGGSLPQDIDYIGQFPQNIDINHLENIKDEIAFKSLNTMLKREIEEFGAW
jgi:hypothetical protein